MAQIKLHKIPVNEYSKHETIIQEKLEHLPPITLSLNSSVFLKNMDEQFQINCYSCVKAMVPENRYDHYHAFVFDINIDPEISDKLSFLTQNNELNKKTLRSLRGYYHKLYKKSPKNLQEILNTFNNAPDFSHHLLGLYYDTRYHPDTNTLTTHDMYSGKLRGQGLMTRFFQQISDVIDISGLDYLGFGEIVEANTINMFNPLRRKIPDDKYLSELLKRKYIKSPLIRLLCRLDLKNIEIITYDGFIGDLKGRKSDTLKFTITEKNKSD